MRESPSSVYCLTRPTTPTTVSQGAAALASMPPNRMRFPSGSSFGHSCCAIASSMTTTRGLVRVSSLVKRRPFNSGISIARK